MFIILVIIIESEVIISILQVVDKQGICKINLGKSVKCFLSKWVDINILVVSGTKDFILKDSKVTKIKMCPLSIETQDDVRIKIQRNTKPYDEDAIRDEVNVKNNIKP